MTSIELKEAKDSGELLLFCEKERRLSFDVLLPRCLFSRRAGLRLDALAWSRQITYFTETCAVSLDLVAQSPASQMITDAWNTSTNHLKLIAYPLRRLLDSCLPQIKALSAP